MLAVLCTGVFAAEFLGWDCRDKDALTSAIADNSISGWKKLAYAGNLELLNNPDAFKTFDDLKAFVDKKNKEYNTKSTYVDQIVWRSRTLAHLVPAAVDHCIAAKDSTLIFFAERGNVGVINKSQSDIWRAVADILIDKNVSPKLCARGVNVMIATDIRITKSEKVEVYTLLYEKYMPKLADEQNLTNEQKVYTPILSKLALKLKALGVDIVK